MERTVAAGEAARGSQARFGRVAAGLFLPSTVDLVFLTLAFAVPLGFTSRLFASDGDVGRHIRVGSDILASHTLFFRDQYSFTMAGQPFVPYEWLSEVLFAFAHQLGGLAAVAVLTGLVIALTYGVVVIYLRLSGVDPLLAMTVGFCSAAIGLLHWLARPHLFTPLGAIVTIILLERTGRRALWLFLPLFVLWANLHGGFVYGLVLIGLYLAGDLVELFKSGTMRRSSDSSDALARRGQTTWLERSRVHGAALLLGTVGCCVNPSGPALFRHVTAFLGDRLLVDRTLEYMSPDFHDPFGQMFLIVLLGCVAAIALSSTRPSYPHLFVFIVNLAFALYSWRNIPLFAVTALPIVMLTVDPWWRRLGLIKRPRTSIAKGERDSAPGLGAAVGAAVLVIVALNHGQFAGISVASRFDSNHFPVAAVEAARASNVTGRLYNELIWGGYVLYAWPEQRVFIDGQTDFYGDNTSRRYLQISELQDGWREALRDDDITVVLVPTSSLLARELVREPGWRTWYRDPTAVILTRTP